MAIVTDEELMDLGFSEEFLEEMSDQLYEAPELLIEELAKKFPNQSILVVEGSDGEPYTHGGENDTEEYAYATSDGRTQEETHVSLETALEKYKFAKCSFSEDEKAVQVDTADMDQIEEQVGCECWSLFDHEDVDDEEFYTVPGNSAHPRADEDGFVDNSKYPSPNEYEVIIVIPSPE